MNTRNILIGIILLCFITIGAIKAGTALGIWQSKELEIGMVDNPTISNPVDEGGNKIILTPIDIIGHEEYQIYFTFTDTINDFHVTTWSCRADPTYIYPYNGGYAIDIQRFLSNSLIFTEKDMIEGNVTIDDEPYLYEVNYEIL